MNALRARMSEVWQQRLARGAKWGFWLFLAKGLLWLLVPALMAFWASDANAQEPALPVQALDARTAEQPALEQQAPEQRWHAQAEAAERSVELRQVVVTGTHTAHALSDSPVDVQLITRRQIADSGARDVQQLLEREGGLTVSRVAGRGSSIEIQGLSSEQVLILVDGQRVVGRINGAIDLTRLKTESIERIEIIKGPSSALYGSDALGGVVNIITKSGGHGANVLTQFDSGGNGEVSGGWDYGRGSVSAGGTLTTHYDLDKSTPATDGVDGNDRFLNARHRLGLWRDGDDALLNFDYALGNSSSVQSGTAVYDITKRSEELRAGATPRLHFGEDKTLTLSSYYTRFYDQFLQVQRGSDANDSYQKTIDQLASVGAQWDQKIGAHALTFGLDHQYEQLESDRIDSTGHRRRQDLFAQDEFRLFGERLTLVPGLRYDRDSQFGTAVTPKLALRYDLSEHWLLRAGGGEGYRAPDFKQLLLFFNNPAVGYRVVGNPNLKPERSTGFNVGSTWLASPALSFSGNAYYNRVRDLIDIIQTTPGQPRPGSTVIFSYTNVENARLMGFDGQAEWQPLLGARRPLVLRLGYGYLDSEDTETGLPLSGRAKHRTNLDLGWRQPLYALDLRGVWIGQRIFQVELDTGGAPTGAGTAKPYALFDARAEWKGWRTANLAVGISNLLDAGDTRYLPIPPRAVYLQLSKEFR